MSRRASPGKFYFPGLSVNFMRLPFAYRPAGYLVHQPNANPVCGFSCERISPVRRMKIVTALRARFTLNVTRQWVVSRDEENIREPTVCVMLPPSCTHTRARARVYMRFPHACASRSSARVLRASLPEPFRVLDSIANRRSPFKSL